LALSSQSQAEENDKDKDNNNDEDKEGEQSEDEKIASELDRRLLKRALSKVENFEELLEELEIYGMDEDFMDDDEDDYFFDEWDEETLEEFFQSLPEEEDEDNADENETYLGTQRQFTSLLEKALLQGVVPAEAGVGSNSLPGDYNFDPLNLATKDYFSKAQAYIRDLVPARDGGTLLANKDNAKAAAEEKPRPQALILRDYREAEIRHGRLAMLAAVFWPLQELLDRLVLDEDKFDSLLYSLFFGGVTLPYFPLLMTAIMLLLGYLDIYSQAVKDMDKIGEAFLPGDCFWDPLQMLTAAPDQMKRNMQERELFNGRFAMLAIAVFTWEEASTGKPVVDIEGNEILFEPAYQVPFIQKWLDERFASSSPSFYDFGEDETPLVEAITAVDLFLGNLADTFPLL